MGSVTKSPIFMTVFASLGWIVYLCVCFCAVCVDAPTHRVLCICTHDTYDVTCARKLKSFSRLLVLGEKPSCFRPENKSSLGSSSAAAAEADSVLYRVRHKSQHT